MDIISIALLVASLVSIPSVTVAYNQPVIEVISIDQLISDKSRLYGVNEALVGRIIFCESSFRIDAINTNRNGSTDKGLLQINSIHNTEGFDLLNPEDNLDFGLAMMKKQGVRPWKASRGCWSK